MNAVNSFAKRGGLWKLGRRAMILVTIMYLGIVLLIPNVYLLVKAFEPGWGEFWKESASRYMLAALSNTLIVTAVSLVVTIPLGVLTALVLVRDTSRWKRVIDGFIDLPFAAPAAISAFALLLAYGPRSLLGSLLTPMGFKIIFAMPGMILATIFVTLPFVIREVVPLLEEMGTESQEAARTLGASSAQTLFLITIPGVAEGILYGASLSFARALGEFGAILVISGNILGSTQTMPIYIYDRYINFEMRSAWTGAALLMILAIIGMALLEAWRKRLRDGGSESAGVTR